MRIAIFCPSFGAVGGIEEIAVQLINEFRRGGHDVDVLARGDRSSLQRLDGVSVYRESFHQIPRRSRHLVREVRFALHLRPTVARFATIVADRRSDVVLTLAISTYAPYIDALSRWVPLVMSLQGGEADERLTSRPRALRRALVSADHVVACASSLAKQACRLAPDVSQRVSTIPNGVDPSRFEGVSPFPHGRPYVLAVGRMVRQKGFDTLLEAFARLPPALSVDLLFAGDGPERAALEARGNVLGVTGRVHFLGVQSPAAVSRLYRGALAFACPSRWEGLPLVCLEAMASARPVVATAVDGIPDAIEPGETGLLVPPDDPEHLAGALTTLIRDREFAERLGVAGQRVVADRFSWRSVGARYLDVLTSSASSHPGGLTASP